jgi:oligoendopeptidase F
MKIAKTERIFLPSDFSITTWNELATFYDILISENNNSVSEFEIWLKKISELESVVSEDLAWRYIRMTCDTSNKEFEKSYLDFIENIQPQIAPLENNLNQKLVSSPFLSQLEHKTAYSLYFKQIKTSIELFREENIPLETKAQTLAQEYGAISGQMSVEWQGKELTLQQASVFLKSNDRDERKEAYLKIQDARFKHQERLQEIFTELIQIRNQIAINAGFKNYRDYKFKALGRFDYTPEDCFNFHNAVANVVVPLKKKLHKIRKHKLQLDTLKPWDTSVDPDNLPKLQPFSNGDDLLKKTVKAFNRIDPYFGDCIETMNHLNHLDLDSRKGKAPGGYNYPLAETGVPFIFMNAAGLQRDLETMVHEGGHAIHSFLTRDLPLNAFKNTPSEVAELASMSMELLSMDVWNEFYNNPDDLKRAQTEQLESIIHTLPWIATIDAFQHWIYTHPNHTVQERTNAWLEISAKFETGEIDYSGLEHFRGITWQAQLHLYEVPFYYIEYGFAQLGAVGVWKKFNQNKNKALEDYKNALKAGYTLSIPEIYSLAGVKFNFTEEYLKSLFDFIEIKLKELG